MPTEFEDRFQESLIGRVLGGKFKLRSCIGAGSSGTVYEADQTTLNRTVAVKILNPELATDERLVNRFHDEAMAASRLNHPNTVSVIDYGQTHDGLLYIIMEFLRGMTLTRIIQREMPLPDPRIVDNISQILSGLEEAHAAGIIHADLKSDNIVVEHRRGGWDLVKVVDFGIARLLNAPQTERKERTICGTPEYMAPEVISGQDPTFASDLYAVGVIIYEMLTGQTPFVGGSALDVLRRHLQQEPLAPSKRCPELSINPAIEAIVMRALSKQPSKRYDSATVFRQELQEVLEEHDTVDTVPCAACGVPSAVSFKYCPECGSPRQVAGGVVAQPVENIATEPHPAPAVVRGTVEHDTLFDLDAAPTVLPLPLVGRAAVLQSLIEFVAGRGSGHALHLIAEPGSGASRVLDDLCDRVAESDNRAVFRVGPDTSGLSAPLYAIRDLVAQILSVPSDCSFERLGSSLESVGLTRRDLPGLAELFGHHNELWQLETSVRHRELLGATLRVLQAAAHPGGALMVFDDIHRYDQPSLELLSHLQSAKPTGKLRLVASMAPRFTDLDDPDVGRVKLSRLTSTALVQLADHLATTGPTGMPDADALREHTDGTPLHIEQLVRYAIEGGEAEHAPLTIADLIAERASTLRQSALILCQSAAVFGEVVSCAHVQRAIRDRVASFDEALAVARARGFLRHEPERKLLVFPHRLVREVIYDATPADVRRELHTAAAEVLSSTTTDPLVLGHHYERGGHLIEGANLLMLAGDDAVHQLDDVGATELYQRALAAARSVMLRDDDDASRSRFVTLSVKLADALRISGQVALARGIVDEARTYSDGNQSLDAQLLRASAHLALTEGNSEVALDTLRSAIGSLITIGKSELIAEIYLDLASVHESQGDVDAALSELQECLDMVTLGEGASADRGPRVLWRVLLRMARLYHDRGQLDQALPLALAAVAHARRTDLRTGVARAESLLAQCYDRLGDSDEARRHRDAAVDQMRRIGDRRATAELLLAGVQLSSRVLRITPDSLRYASDLADRAIRRDADTDHGDDDDAMVRARDR